MRNHDCTVRCQVSIGEQFDIRNEIEQSKFAQRRCRRQLQMRVSRCSAVPWEVLKHRQNISFDQAFGDRSTVGSDRDRIIAKGAALNTRCRSNIDDRPKDDIDSESSDTRPVLNPLVCLLYTSDAADE